MTTFVLIWAALGAIPVTIEFLTNGDPPTAENIGCYLFMSMLGALFGPVAFIMWLTDLMRTKHFIKGRN